MRARAGAEEALRQHTVQLADPQVVRGHVKDLKAFLENSGIVERKAFLKSFVERIDVELSQVTITYTIPVGPDKSPPAAEAVGVLPFVQDGPTDWTRTISMSHFRGART